MKTYNTNYHVAAHWLNNSLILCNEIAIKEVENGNPEFAIFHDEWEDENGDRYDDYDDIPEELQDSAKYVTSELFQYYLTDCTDYDVKYLREHFGLLFDHSETLDLWVLCVDHCGTAWDYVNCKTDLECASAELGERKR